jgi:hypothetical protein
MWQVSSGRIIQGVSFDCSASRAHPLSCLWLRFCDLKKNLCLPKWSSCSFPPFTLGFSSPFLKQHTDDLLHNLFKREDRQGQGKKGNGCCCHHREDGRHEIEWSRPHLADDLKAVRQIGEGLNIRASDQCLPFRRLSPDPLPLKGSCVFVGQNPIFKQPLPLRIEKLR